MEANKGLIFTITGPSGAGKDTLANELISRDGQIQFFPTATTRAPREGEKDGVDYYFLSKDAFKEKIVAEEILEWSEHYHNFYGTLKKVVQDHLQAGHDIMTDITWSGAAAIRKAFPKNTICFCIMPPSLEALEARLAERRLRTKEESASHRIRTEKVRVDMQYAHQSGYIFTNEDMVGSVLSDYDYVITNTTVDEAVGRLVAILAQERQKRGR